MVACVVVFHSLDQALKIDEGSAGFRVANVGAAVAVVKLCTVTRTRRLAYLLGAALATWRMILDFPHSANHTFLEFLFFVLVLACGADGVREFNRLCPQVAGAILAWSGLQKAAYGAFLTGSTLAYLASTDVRFAPLYRLFELEPGHGCENIPPVFATLGTSVVVLEVVVGLALVTGRAQRLAAATALGLLVGIEIFAREYAFGGLMFALLAMGLSASYCVAVHAALCVGFLAATIWALIV